MIYQKSNKKPFQNCPKYGSCSLYKEYCIYLPNLFLLSRLFHNEVRIRMNRYFCILIWWYRFFVWTLFQLEKNYFPAKWHPQARLARIFKDMGTGPQNILGFVLLFPNSRLWVYMTHCLKVRGFLLSPPCSKHSGPWLPALMAFTSWSWIEFESPVVNFEYKLLDLI